MHKPLYKKKHASNFNVTYIRVHHTHDCYVVRI